MGTARAFTGRYANILERASLSSSGAANSLYPLARLVDLQPDKDARANAAGADDTITGDVNLTTNPGLGSWSGGAPAGWTVIGTVVETTTAGEFRTTPAAKITGNSSALQQDVTVRAGQKLTLEAFARISAANAVGSVVIQNRHTGKYLTSGGAWQAGSTSCGSTTSTSFTNIGLPFQVEDYGACGDKNEVTLRIQLVASGDAAQFAFFDDILLLPGFDFMAVFGHNLDPLITPQFRTSTDNFSASDENQTTGSGSFQPYAFYLGLSSVVYRRYLRLKMVGTNVTGPWSIGEWFAGQMVTPVQQYESIDWTPYRQWNRQQSRNPVGKRFGHRRTLYPIQGLSLSYHFDTQAQLDDAFDIWDRAQGGTWPVVIVPDIDRPEVIHGFLPDSFSISRELTAYYTGLEISIEGSPFASAT